MLNPTGSAEISLTVFGGVDTDLSPTDLPQGLSPDAMDCAFIPGSVFTRPPLQRFSTLGTTAQIVYTASFTKPNGVVVQLVFDSLGGMYADGVKIGQTAAGNRFKVENAFGKAYIAISDGLRGADVPLQFDGVNLDRVSQDGPGAPPSVANFAIPPVQLIAGAGGAAVSISTATPIDPEQTQVGSGYNDEPSGGSYQPPQYETYYTALMIVTASPHGLTAGESVTMAGNSLYNPGVVYVTAIDSATSFEVSYRTMTATVGAGGTVTPTAALLVRSNNVVAANTAMPHGLRTGYRVNITNVPDATLGITSIVVDNTSLPGVATVTTSTPNGYVPGDVVSLAGIQPAVVGGSITNYTTTTGGTTTNVTTITTATAHNLQVNDVVTVSLGPSGGVGASFVVASVASPTVFTINNPRPDPSGTSGFVHVPWVPISGSEFTVIQTPSPTTFQIAVTQGNATWTTGTVSFPWDGTFYVTSILSATAFTYSQPGPDDSTQASSGTVTPLGQIAPGQRKVRVLFQTRTGYITAPSLATTINASGSQYLFVTNIPIGPPNVIARVLAFTGANGADYFYLPVAPQNQGQAIGTSTVIPDNVTTSAVFDFSDQSLFAALAIGIPGNNLFALNVMGPCLSFTAYASRLLALGTRNKIEQFRNMGFEGGYLASAPTLPLTWIVPAGAGVLAPGDYGMGFAFSAVNSPISQPAYQDEYGVAILIPQTQYTARCWTTGPTTCDIYSASMGVLATATMTASGGFTQADFSAKTPVSIPPDTVLRWSSSLVGTKIDELEIIYTANPYFLAARVSYANNPESFDGVTGVLGPAVDPQPVMALSERRDVLALLTYGPSGSLYESEDSASGEPSSWSLRHVASQCGIISTWGIAKFEDWFCWASDTGLRIYDGGTVDKMSQEVQQWWDSFNPLAKQLTVLANDPYLRRLYILACVGTATVQNSTWVMDYRELNTASAITNSGTLRVALSGKVITTDLTRKWCPWTITANYCGIVSLNNGGAVMVFCGGSGSSLSYPLHSALYTLQEGSLAGVDADYGPFWQTCTYPTYFFLSAEEAQQNKLGVHRLHHGFMTLNVDGIGAITVRPMLDRLDNYARAMRPVKIYPDMARDLEFGLNVTAERVSYRIGVQPQAGQSEAGFKLSELTVSITTDAYSPIRGRNG